MSHRLPETQVDNIDDNDSVAKIVDSATEPDVKVSVKSRTKEDALTVTFTGGIRTPSPNPSVLSVDNFGRLGRRENVGHGRRCTSRSPAPPAKTLREKLKVFWVENLGLILVLVSQLFGTLMNVTTRMLEVEGNNDSLLYLPLADATVITFLAPSLACWACSFLIHEPFTRMEQIAAYISLFGVVLIARPVTLFTSLRSNNDPVSPASRDPEVEIIRTNGTDPSHRLASSYDNVTPAQRASAVGIAMLGVVGAAGAYTTIRWIGRRAHPLISVNYFAMWCTLVSIVMMSVLPDVDSLLPQSWVDFSYLIFLGVCGFIMQFLLAAGLQYEKSSRATNMVYVQMLFALSFDKIVFGTTPRALSILGSSLILGSAIYVATHKEDPKKDEGRRERGSGEEERGLMDMRAEGGSVSYDNDNEIQMRTLR
ncbi:hypothetical protein SLS60_000662 [Paraconiothyrium brasiliense]|uniref:EamA domain-containing protein n=1 Tax=Paraconiothyrium brasiliense TaxID=300254 RepID=A0ABR3S700_9PLEO